jgi:hypothetical protein
LFAATIVEAAPALSSEGVGVGVDPTILPVGSSRVTGSANSAEVDDNPLKSTLLPNDVMDRYLERAKKMKAELKKVAMFDHEWWLKTFDLNGSGVVKLWCGECKKDCGGGSKDHTKAHNDNLLNNFRRSHILSTTHIRNFCAAKNVDFDDHPQSEAKNGRPLTLTPEDHKRLISEGVEILEGVNVALPDGHKKFTVLGNLTAEDTMCYWFKVKCQYCRDMMVLYPPRKTLEVNLRNHLTGPKHKKVVEVAEQLLKEPARTGRVGRPSKSTTTSSHSNQCDLHTWFRMASSNNMEGTSQVVDRNIIEHCLIITKWTPAFFYNL